MDSEQTRAPSTTAGAAGFPQIIPEPQLLTLYSGAVQRPAELDLELAELEADERGLAAWLLHHLGAIEYDVDIEVQDDFAPEEVPPDALAEAYELEILPDGATITARTEPGARWGLKTLSDVLKAIPVHGSIPAARILDWPTMKTRGVFIEDKWGPDLMELADWKALIDYLAERKLNNLGIGLYGCWCVQYDGRITEWLMTPVPDRPELKSEWTIRWYSPSKDAIEEITYLPPIFEKDLLGKIVAYGQEKGVEVIPYVNSLGHNTLIPRLIPEFAAKNEAGEPEEFGYCLSNPDVIEFVKGWYQHIYEKYLKPNGVHTFHIQCDEVGKDFCKCAECSKASMEEMLKEYVIGLVKHLVSVGVQDVVLYNDQFTRHLDKNTFDEAFMQRLRDEGIFDNIIVDWWAYTNACTYPDVHPNLGRGLRGWVKPMTCYYNWSRWDPRQKNVAVMLELGHREGAEGAASYSVFDPAYTLSFDALAEYSWNFRGAGPMHRFEEKWAAVRADGDVLEAIRWLDRAFETDLLNVLAYYAYTYNRAGKPWPRQYPQEALEEVVERAYELDFIAEAGARAAHLLEGRTDEVSLNLIAEAARMEALGLVFAVMRDVWEMAHDDAEAKRDACTAALQVEGARDAVVEAMALIEDYKPHYLVPCCLRDMSVLWEFSGQLIEDLNEVAAGERQWPALRWFVAGNIAQREWEIEWGSQ